MFQTLGMNAIGTGRGILYAPTRFGIGSQNISLASNPKTGISKIDNSESPSDRHARLYPVIQRNVSLSPPYVPPFQFLAGTRPNTSAGRIGGDRSNLKLTRKLAKHQHRITVSQAKAMLFQRTYRASTDDMTGLEYITSYKARPNVPSGVNGMTYNYPHKTAFVGRMPGLNGVNIHNVNRISATPIPTRVSGLPILVSGNVSTYSDHPMAIANTTNEAQNTKPNLWPVVIMAIILILLLAKGRV